MNALVRDFSVCGCTLRHFSRLPESSLLTVYAWRNDPRVAPNMLRQTFISLAEHMAFCGELSTDPTRAYWMVLRDGAEIGVVYLHGIDRECARAFLGMYANPRLIGSGVGDLLLQCIEHIAFTHLGLRELYLQVRRENSRARALYRKHGYVEVPSPEDGSSQESSGTMITMYKQALHHLDE